MILDGVEQKELILDPHCAVWDRLEGLGATWTSLCICLLSFHKPELGVI